MKKSMVSSPVVSRLPRYYRCLVELNAASCVRVSSRTLADRLGLTASQIRQDFSCFGEFGQQGYGYNVRTLLAEISDILGITRSNTAILVGCGNLGRAIAGHLDFQSCGITLMGAFDQNPDLEGTRVGELTILSTDRMQDFVRNNHPHIAVLTVPGEFAQQVADDLADWGVRSFWNLAGKEIFFADPGINVENTSLLDSLLTLSYRLKEASGE